MRVDFDDLNGYTFSVKSKTFASKKVQREIEDDLMNWYKTNNKSLHDALKKFEEQMKKENNPDALNGFTKSDMEAWHEDEVFRSERMKKMAVASMKFDKEPPESLWKSEDLEVGKIELAYSFFTGVRQIPIDAI